LNPDLFYKRDIGIRVNDGWFLGVTVVPYSSEYSIELTPRGDMDLILLRTCHREFTVEKYKGSSGFIFWKSAKTFQYRYIPVPQLENRGVCPMRVDVYEEEDGRHSWAFLDFEHPDYTLRAELICNGEVVSVNGVGVCQAKSETVQAIRLMKPVRFAPPEPSGCSIPSRVGNHYEIDVSLGECLYTYDSEDGQLGRLTVIGYEGVLVRGDGQDG